MGAVTGADRTHPIAVFDSGVGGLTVLHECLVSLPHEDFLYLGDTARFPYGTRSREELVEFARDCDLFLVEATLPRPERTGQRGHLTPGEAGEHGREAGAKRVVLTHISDELDQLWAQTEADGGFGSHVDIAREGAAYDI